MTCPVLVAAPPAGAEVGPAVMCAASLGIANLRQTVYATEDCAVRCVGTEYPRFVQC
jgi:tRNA(Arg) A34 adenosine deaminase TadA